MAVTQIGKVTLNLRSTLTNALDLQSAVTVLSTNVNVDLPDGTAAGQANMTWSDQRTLAASATEDLDFAGVLTSIFGAVLTFAKIKAILIKAAAGNTNAVRVARATANGLPLFVAALDAVDVLPGGCFFWMGQGAGITVTPATGDLLTITNGGAGTAVTYDIVVIGTV